GARDAVVRVLGRILRQADAEGRPLLHALEDEVGAVGIALLHAAQPRRHVVLLAYPLLGPFDRDRVIARVGFHPILVIGRPLAQRLLADLRHPDDLTEEVDDQLGPRQRRQIAANDNPVEAVIDEDQEVAEQLGEQIHGSPLDTRQGSKGDPASTGQTDGGGEELSPRRRGPLHPAPSCRPPWARRHCWSACPVVYRNRRRLAARPVRSTRRKAGPRRRPRTRPHRRKRYLLRHQLEGQLSHRGTRLHLFRYSDRQTRRVSTILGYPTHLLAPPS